MYERECERASGPDRVRRAVRRSSTESAERARRSRAGTATPGRRSPAGSPAACSRRCCLLAATWGIAGLSGSGGFTVQTIQPPVSSRRLGQRLDEPLERNLLVLALHAMACVARLHRRLLGADPGRAAPRRRALVHERGGRFAIVFVVAATTFSLSAQSIVLGGEPASVAHALHTTPGALLLGVLPHAVIELTALFLPLAAWIIASRRGEWDQLLAATMVTVAIALPMLLARLADRGLHLAASAPRAGLGGPAKPASPARSLDANLATLVCIVLEQRQTNQPRGADPMAGTFSLTSPTTVSRPRCSSPRCPCSSTSGLRGARRAGCSRRCSSRSPRSVSEDLRIVKLNIDDNQQTTAVRRALDPDDDPLPRTVRR